MNYRKLLLIVPAVSFLICVATALLFAAQVNWRRLYDIVAYHNTYPLFLDRDEGYSIEWTLGCVTGVSLIVGGVAFWRADKNLSRGDWYKVGQLLAIIVAAIIVAVSLHWKTAEN